ncbi:hypothetical protein UPYG_G00011590 [Umbra pygmaea]|uniref:Uncharacterized protein n=1 Tax=Umbra pygmaea TaxID=75934 RepID=A0ABD0XIW9_UMBPY
MWSTDCVVKTKIITRKKVSKPLMEKKRRARINKCLDQLKSILENNYTSNIRKRKLEKADILELTVKHLRNLQKIQSGTSINIEFADYQAGYRSCLAGVNQYLADNSSGISSRSMLTNLSKSLNCAERHAHNSSTAQGETGVKHVLPETAVCYQKQQLLSSTVWHETNNALHTVPNAHCAQALKPHASVSDTKLVKLSPETRQVITSPASKNKLHLGCKGWHLAARRIAGTPIALSDGMDGLLRARNVGFLKEEGAS